MEPPPRARIRTSAVVSAVRRPERPFVRERGELFSLNQSIMNHQTEGGHSPLQDSDYVLKGRAFGRGYDSYIPEDRRGSGRFPRRIKKALGFQTFFE